MNDTKRENTQITLGESKDAFFSMILTFKNRLIRRWIITSVFKLCRQKPKSRTCLRDIYCCSKGWAGPCCELVKDTELYLK